MGLLSKERWSLSTKPPGKDLLLILLLLLGWVLVRCGRRRVDVFTVFAVLFVVLIDRGLNGYAGGTNWAGIADKIGNHYFLIRLPFRRVGELIDAGVGVLRDIESFETWGSKSFRIRGVGTSDALSSCWL